ncbi:uncharacterized protein B0I36DRAFT_340907 [Microdochium trichocladiopsis]|uniref:DUF6594 domain-containing protein n=1 Tax=Microdochium trichocladiopsis TaxID=1682393 RepID=A0A9P8XQU8_9PEZI|nr:uncharacterized protein B0I36DRAFT_340907 [Microdochium trichocladiopsis]KAH7012309.1 hypothetical protein B0I36DRAFT_340907 [Microdochium trichocladiopsis]
MEPPTERSHSIPGAAAQVAAHCDLQSIIVRRFDKLAIQNILELHAELAEIDKGHSDVQRAADETLRTDETLRSHHARHHASKNRASENYHSAITAYHEAIVRYSDVVNLSRPPAVYVRDLVEMLKKEGNDGAWAIWDGNSPMGGRPFSDLVAISTFSDPLTRFISSTWLMFLFVDIIGSIKQGKALIDLTSIRRFVAILQALISIGFLVGAMWALYKLTDMVTRLALVTGFVAAFCGWFATTTGIQRRDIFAATAAYAAVLVVYVGSQADQSGTCTCATGV